MKMKNVYKNGLFLKIIFYFPDFFLTFSMINLPGGSENRGIWEQGDLRKHKSIESGLIRLFIYGW